MSGLSTDWGSPSGTGVPPSAVMSVSAWSVIPAGLFSPTQVSVHCLSFFSLCLPIDNYPRIQYLAQGYLSNTLNHILWQPTFHFFIHKAGLNQSPSSEARILQTKAPPKPTSNTLYSDDMHRSLNCIFTKMTEYWQTEKYFHEPVSNYPSMWRTLPNSQVSRQSSSVSPCDTAKTPITRSDMFCRSSLAIWGTVNLDWIPWNSFPVLTVVRFSSTPHAKKKKKKIPKSQLIWIFRRKKMC